MEVFFFFSHLLETPTAESAFRRESIREKKVLNEIPLATKTKARTAVGGRGGGGGGKREKVKEKNANSVNGMIKKKKKQCELMCEAHVVHLASCVVRTSGWTRVDEGRHVETLCSHTK